MQISADRRREKILENLNRDGSVRVAALSREFSVSEVTIRGDLEYLEAQGSLCRNHGGAVPMNRLYADMDIAERYRTNASDKKALASLFSDLVSDNDTIFLNSGTTITYILREIREKQNIRIVTNSIQNAYEATSYLGFHVVLLGGQVESKYQFTYGDDTIEQLSWYHAAKCILSVDGVDAKNGYSLYYNSESAVVEKMAEQADCVLIAADRSKIGRTAFSRIAPLDIADAIVTNRLSDAEFKDVLAERKIRLYEA